jgi:Holliday junction resolvasome RuvABC endonuclease subunit
MILGFDLSTTVCGYCVLNDNGEIKALAYYSFKSKEMLEKANELKEILKDLFELYPITKFFIEERLQGFRAGGTNADAMFKTAALNFHCQVLINERSIPITALNVNNARSVSFQEC